MGMLPRLAAACVERRRAGAGSNDAASQALEFRLAAAVCSTGGARVPGARVLALRCAGPPVPGG